MRIAVTASKSDASNDNRGDLERAEHYVAEAAAAGAELVLLPETFPGRWRRPISSTPLPELQAMARTHGVFVAGGYAEPVGDSPDRCYNTVSLCGPDGAEHGRYRRVAPSHAPWIYRGGRLWDFDWTLADELPVMRVGDVTVGIIICSEIYVPELSRILAAQGAEVILAPAGVARRTSELFSTWRTVAWARAIENLAAVALSSNGTAQTGDGLAMVFSPEEVLLDTSDEGVHVVDVDIDRIRWLRNEADRLTDGPKPWRTKPGVLRDWRRADLFARYEDVLIGEKDRLPAG